MITQFKGTKGYFYDGHTGWKISDRETNGTKGYEIHYTDSGECITDHVYTIEDAKLIANSPKLLEALENILRYSVHFPEVMNGELHFAQRIIKEILS